MRSVRRRAPGYPITLAAFLVAGFAAHGPSLGAFFLADDFHLIRELTNGGALGVWPSDDRFFRPVSSVSLYLDVALWGLSAVGYHMTGVLLHVVNALLLVLLVATATREDDPQRRGPGWTALLAGGLYLLHPSHSEAVAWIACRGDLLAVLFSLAALLAYAAFRQGRILPPWASGGLTVVATALALLAKESALFLPALLLFLELSPWTRPRPDDGRNVPPWLTLALVAAYPAYFVVRRLALGQWLGGYGEQMHLELGLWRSGGSMATYLFRAFLPPLEAAPGTLILFVVSAAVAGLCLLRGSADERPRRRALLPLAAVALAASLVPAVNMGTSLVGTQGERFIYAATLFSSVMVAALLRGRLRGVPLVVAAAALLLASATVTHLASWRWYEAGRLSRQILDQVLAKRDRKNLMVLNLPDNLDGAYVYRGGLPDAVALFGKEVRAPVACAVRHALGSPDDTVTVVRRGRVVDLRLEAPHPVVPSLVRPSRHFEPCRTIPKYLRMVGNGSGWTVRVRIVDATQWTGVLYFSEGKIKAMY